MSTPEEQIDQSQFIWAGGQFAPTPPGGMAEVSALLRELIGINRELLENSRQQLELSKRWEQRTAEQIQMQRDDLNRLAKDHPELKGRARGVEETVAQVLGKSLNDLYDYIEHHGEDISDSDYVRAELIEKYGGMLAHLSGMHGMVKRIALFEQSQNKQPPTA